MSHFRSIVTIILLTVLFPVVSAQPPDLDRLSPEQAREILGMIVENMQQSIVNSIKAKTGVEMNMSIAIENDAMIYTMTFANFSPTSTELSRFLIAANRQGGQTENIRELMLLLSKAGYRIGYRYKGDAGSTEYVMLPEEFFNLMTKPIEELNFDRGAILTEFIEIFNRNINNGPDKEQYRWREATVEGRYLTLKAVIDKEHPILADSRLDNDIKLQIANLLINSPNSFFFKCLAKGAAALNLQGVKYNVSDPVGNQRIINLDWNELNRLALEASKTTPAEAQLKIIDDFLTHDVAKTTDRITFTHSTEPPILILVINYDFPSETFAKILDNTPEENILKTYAEAMKQLLPMMPEISTVRTLLINTDGNRRQTDYPRSTFIR